MFNLTQARVLIVDDNRQMRFLVQSVLRAVGIYHCQEASDAFEAFECLKNTPTNLIITDIAMKPLDGIEFTRLLRMAPDSPGPSVPILIMTGHSERWRVTAARDAGANGFLAKPISAKSMLQHIGTTLQDNRRFVRTGSFYGPDRRRGPKPGFQGPMRRSTDFDDSFNLDSMEDAPYSANKVSR